MCAGAQQQPKVRSDRGSNSLTDRLGANLDGMLAEYAVLSEETLVHLPSHLSFEEAATLPCAAVTAWVALTGHRGVVAGDTVLTQGSGGVSVLRGNLPRSWVPE
jgi:NADPH:quinone reductase-like Zn-dependent oxidoreductase